MTDDEIKAIAQKYACNKPGDFTYAADVALVDAVEDAIKEALALEAARATAHITPESVGLPSYPAGVVVGACVCGSWPGGECLKCTVIPARATAEQGAKLQAVKNAGFKMSNIFFNLAQRPWSVLTPLMCEGFDTCRKEWDDAIRALKSQQDAAIESQRSGDGS